MDLNVSAGLPSWRLNQCGGPRKVIRDLGQCHEVYIWSRWAILFL